MKNGLTFKIEKQVAREDIRNEENRNIVFQNI